MGIGDAAGGGSVLLVEEMPEMVVVVGGQLLCSFLSLLQARIGEKMEKEMVFGASEWWFQSRWSFRVIKWRRFG